MNTPSVQEIPRASLLPFIQAFFILLWSSGALIIVIGLRYTGPLTFLFYRLLFAALIMLFIAVITKAPWPTKWLDIKKIAVTGLLMQFAYITSFFCALYYGVSPTVMTIILGLQPILTAIIASGILKNRVEKYEYIGIFIGLAGVFLTVSYDLSMHTMTISGLIFALISVCSITVGSVIQKSNPTMDLRTGSIIQFAASLIPLSILNFFFGSFKLPPAPIFLFSVGWMALVVSVGATCLYYKLLRDGNAIAVNSLFYMVPAVTAVLCYFIFNTLINLFTLIGVIFIVFGVFITQRKTPPVKS